MANRIAQLVERGTAFRRAAMWTINTVMGAGAMGVEVTIAGKLRSERAHFEKHVVGVMPKSGNSADKIVKLGVTDVLTKMGLMGIQLRIALKNEMPSEFELIDSKSETNSNTTLQSDQNVREEIDQNMAEEIPSQKTSMEKKNNIEKNNQNTRKPYQKQNLKTKDIKDKPVKQNSLKEKGEGVKSK
jgi:small subunit ribosomal protein S3